MAKKKKTADPLIDLLKAAKPETMITLIAELAEDRPDVRRECNLRRSAYRLALVANCRD